MLTTPLLSLKQMMYSHLETRDIRIALAAQQSRAEDTLDMLERYNKFLTSPTSPTSRGVYSALSRNSGIKENELYGSIVSGLKVTISRLKSLQDLFSSNRSRVLIASNITTINASALKMASLCDFYDKYSRSLLLSVSHLESINLSNGSAPKSLKKYVERNLNNAQTMSFASILKYNKRNARVDVVKTIREIDDIEVTKETLEAAVALGGASKLDPTGFNYLNIINPLFWNYIGFKSYSEIRLKIIDLDKEELQYLLIRHQELTQLKERGDVDLGTTKTLGKIEDRIDTLRYDIKTSTESMG